jgi:hypothetical protein
MWACRGTGALEPFNFGFYSLETHARTSLRTTERVEIPSNAECMILLMM